MSAGERCEHPRSLVPAAVMGTPSPIYFSTSFLPSSLLFPSPSVVFLCVCVSTVPFLFYSCFPFSQRNKGLEIAGPLVLVNSVEEGCHTRSVAGLQDSGSMQFLARRVLWCSLVSQTSVKCVVVQGRCLGARLPGSRSSFC